MDTKNRQSHLRQSLPRPRILATSLLLGLLSLVLLLAPNLQAQESTVLRCRLSAPTVQVGAQADFVLELQNVTDLYGYELRIAYNSSRVGFIDQDPGQQGINFEVGNFLSPDFVLFNVANEQAGELRFAMTQLSPNPPVSGSGDLVRGQLEGKTPGLVQFTIQDVILSNPAGVAIPVQVQNCTIDVIPGAGETATPTPGTPTPTPGTPTPTPELPPADLDLFLTPGLDASGTVTHSNGSVVSVLVPAGSVDEDIVLQYREVDAPGTSPAEYAFAGIAFTLEAYRGNVLVPNYVLNGPMQFSLNYTDQATAGLNEAQLMLFRLNQATASWGTEQILVTSIDTVVNRVQLTLDRVGFYSLFSRPLPVSTPAADTGEIAGSVFVDANGNGVQDPGEVGALALVKLYLLGRDRQWADLSDPVDGNFSFTNLPVGSYFIEVTPLVDFDFTYTVRQNNVSIVEVGGSAAADFGIRNTLFTLFMSLINALSGGDTGGTGETPSIFIYLPSLMGEDGQ